MQSARVDPARTSRQLAFQSSPSPKTECNEDEETIDDAATDVPILTQPED